MIRFTLWRKRGNFAWAIAILSLSTIELVDKAKLVYCDDYAALSSALRYIFSSRDADGWNMKSLDGTEYRLTELLDPWTIDDITIGLPNVQKE